MSKLLFFDVETPNGHNDRVCSIGLMTISEDMTLQKVSVLINPEVEFWKTNTDIHGISESDVRGKPTFPEFWKQYSEYFRSSLVIAHNAKFDLSVLKKTLDFYHLDAFDISFVCSYKLAQKFISDTDNYKLDTICKYFGVELEHHHDAMCDCMATYQIVNAMCKKFDIDLDSEVSLYQLNSPIPECTEKHVYNRVLYSNETLALQTLQGILYEITSDGVLTIEEILLLQQWLSEHSSLSGNYPFDQIVAVIDNALSDGKIDANEIADMLSLFNRFVDPISSSACNCDDQIEIAGKLFCLSGEFIAYSKQRVSELISLAGGFVKPNIVKKTNYLVVGGIGNSNWSHGNYGNKVKTALENQEKGYLIQIITEDILMKALEGVS